MFYKFRTQKTSVEYFVSNLCESYSSSNDRESRETSAPYLLDCLAYGERQQEHFDVRSERLVFTDFMNTALALLLFKTKV